MSNLLKVLILEDSDDDVEIIQHYLKKENINFEFLITKDRENFISALDDYYPDVILADNSLPQFSAKEALAIIMKRPLHIPFIVVTGSISEEFAAKIIKLGADDYILKDRLARLPVAVMAAVKQHKTQELAAKVKEDLNKEKMERQQELTRTILQTQEMERNLLGRELHDNINQILASVNLRLGYYLEKPEDNIEIIEICRHILQKAIAEIRKLSHTMVMPSFLQASLKQELELLIDNYSYRKIVQLKLTNIIEDAIPFPIKETLFRIAQEQLSNIAKHAKVEAIEMMLSNRANMLTMVIRDNGIGFDMQQKRKGIGLTNIFNRVEPYNGTAAMVSLPGRGCTLSIKIPLTV